MNDSENKGIICSDKRKEIDRWLMFGILRAIVWIKYDFVFFYLG